MTSAIQRHSKYQRIQLISAGILALVALLTLREWPAGSTPIIPIWLVRSMLIFFSVVLAVQGLRKRRDICGG